MQNSKFEKQVIELLPKLKSYAISLTNNKVKAEDILQEVLYKAIKYQHRFQEGTNLRAWLNTILKNAFYDSLNSRQKRAEKNTDYFAEMHDVSLLNNSVKNKAMENLNIETLTKIIASLEDKYKIPFEMAFRGFKYKEIADRQNIPIGTVKARIFKAKQIIKEQLNCIGYEK